MYLYLTNDLDKTHQYHLLIPCYSVMVVLEMLMYLLLVFDLSTKANTYNLYGDFKYSAVKDSRL
jgi:hypothetical protein